MNWDCGNGRIREQKQRSRMWEHKKMKRSKAVEQGGESWNQEKQKAVKQGGESWNQKDEFMPRILIAGLNRKQFFHYEAAVQNAGFCPIFLPEVLLDRSFCMICAKLLDGLLLPGGGDLHPAHFNQVDWGSRGIEVEIDRMQFRLAEAFLTAGKPVLGICRGMQLLNVLFGGDLYQDLSMEQNIRHAYDTRRQKDRVHDSFLSFAYPPAAIFQKPQRNEAEEIVLQVNSAHHQAVHRLGVGLQAIQWAEDGVIEGFFHPQMPVVGFQWHPERWENPAAADFFAAVWRNMRKYVLEKSSK